jgi:hypothetical protein
MSSLSLKNSILQSCGVGVGGAILKAPVIEIQETDQISWEGTTKSSAICSFPDSSPFVSMLKIPKLETTSVWENNISPF